jgi:hypothetical protein
MTSAPLALVLALLKVTGNPMALRMLVYKFYQKSEKH